MYSKSLFGNISNSQKSLINPINNLINTPFSSNELLFTSEQNTALNMVHKYYTEPLGHQEYSNIHYEYIEYSELYSIISNLEINTFNKTIKLLLKITLEGLIGAIHAFGLNQSIISQNVKSLILNNASLITTFQNNNDAYTLNASNNNYILYKKFHLAPIYSYYIAIFGLPEQSKSFDSNKLKQILLVLMKYNINPYF